MSPIRISGIAQTTWYAGYRLSLLFPSFSSFSQKGVNLSTIKLQQRLLLWGSMNGFTLKPTIFDRLRFHAATEKIQMIIVNEQ